MSAQPDTTPMKLDGSIIDQFRQALSYKQQTMLTITGNTSSFYTILSSSIQLNPNLDYEIALVRFETYNTYYNVTSANNNFSYTNPSGAVRTFQITPGAYQVADINAYIQGQMLINGDYTTNAQTNTNTYGINIASNNNTSRCVLTLVTGYSVNFTIANSIRTLLGFNSEVLNAPTNTSENIIMIQNFNIICVNCDLVSNSYLNAASSQILRVISNTLVPVGYKIIVEPTNQIFLPIRNKQAISDFRVWISDENGIPINFNGETITMTLLIRVM